MLFLKHRNVNVSVIIPPLKSPLLLTEHQYDDNEDENYDDYTVESDKDGTDETSEDEDDERDADEDENCWDDNEKEGDEKFEDNKEDMETEKEEKMYLIKNQTKMDSRRKADVKKESNDNAAA